MNLLKPDEDDLCPCGSKKKWKKCHGTAALRASSLAEDQDVDPALRGFTENAISILQDAIESVPVTQRDRKPTDEEVERQFRQVTLLYCARKLHRTTLAGVTLALRGQTSVALTLKRDQHYAWVAFSHYYDNPRESVLFTASGPLRQRDSALKMMDFRELEGDQDRQKQLDVLNETAELLYGKFPDLRRAKGKSGETENPEYIDWPEPSVLDMFRTIVKSWADKMESEGQPFPNGDKAA
jgi:hypothetical protein